MANLDSSLDYLGDVVGEPTKSGGKQGGKRRRIAYGGDEDRFIENLFRSPNNILNRESDVEAFKSTPEFKTNRSKSVPYSS
jgi:hypothetical protein